MTQDPAAFYDELAPDYELLFDDWWEAAEAHGAVVAGLLARAGAEPPAVVHDVTCGIGTQAIPLARRGYRVVGTDVSTAAVARARREAAARDLEVAFAVADVRTLPGSFDGGADAVISFDNSLAHLAGPDDLERGLGAMRRAVRAGGLLLASVRDYDAVRADRPTGVTPVVRRRTDDRAIVGQAWEWDADGRAMTISLFVLHEGSDGWTTRVVSTRSLALGRDELTDALAHAGFADVAWIEPDDVGYYQPIVTARAT